MPVGLGATLGARIATLSGAGHARSVDNEPESPKSRQEEIRQRIGASRMRLEELRAKRGSDASPATASERLASAQRHLAAAQASTEQAIAAAVRAFRRAAEAHERVALWHIRAAARDSGDKDEHERQAAIHRSAAAEDTERANNIRSLLRQDTGPPVPVTPADSNSSDHRPRPATGKNA